MIKVIYVRFSNQILSRKLYRRHISTCAPKIENGIKPEILSKKIDMWYKKNGSHNELPIQYKRITVRILMLIIKSIDQIDMRINIYKMCLFPSAVVPFVKFWLISIQNLEVICYIRCWSLTFNLRYCVLYCVCAQTHIVQSRKLHVIRRKYCVSRTQRLI